MSACGFLQKKLEFLAMETLVSMKRNCSFLR